MALNDVEAEYRRCIAAMTPAERVARAAELLHWTRETIGRRIVAERGPMSAERLKWEVALRLYGSEPQIRTWIEEILVDVSD